MPTETAFIMSDPSGTGIHVFLPDHDITYTLNSLSYPSTGSVAQKFGQAGDGIVMRADAGATVGLYYSDGSNTTHLPLGADGAALTNPENFRQFGDQSVFINYSNTSIYITDGGNPPILLVSGSTSFEIIGDELFIRTGSSGIEKFDTALNQTTIFASDTAPGTADFVYPQYMWTTGTDLYIRTRDSDFVYDIYKYDTLTDTLTEQNAAEESATSSFRLLGGGDGQSRFFGYFDDGISGSELYVHDGTAGSWQMVLDINPGPTGSQHNYTRSAMLGDQIIFNANDGGADADEVWVSDGTAGGTFALTGTGTPVGPILGAQSFFSTGSLVFFKAYTPSYGYVNIVTDGTVAGTVINDLNPSVYGFPYIMLGTDAGGMYFSSRGFDGSSLWYTDGTSGGIVEIANPTPTTNESSTEFKFLSFLTLQTENIPVQMQTGTAASELLTGTGLRDEIDGAGGNDTIDGDSGDDAVSYASATGAASVYLAWNFGTVGAETDTLVSIENIVGSDFDDRLVGNSGTNDIRGGLGADLIKSNGGNGHLEGEAGNDTIKGGTDAELIDGGEDQDVVASAAGDDTILGGGGDDNLRGNAGNDSIDGGAGNDKLLGGKDNDTLLGGDDNDRLFGDKGHDLLLGGAGVDYLYGGANGEDTLNGGAGDDRLFGEAQSDTFVMEQGGGYDRIKDWEDGVDQIDLTDFGFATFADVQAILNPLAAGVRLDFTSGERLLIEGTVLGDITADDFILS